MYSPFYRRSFVIVTLAILGWALLEIFRPLWTTLGWAAVLAFLLHPLHERLTARFNGRASLSAGILTALTPFLVIAPLVFVGIAFARQVANILAQMSGITLSYPALLQRLDTVPLIGPAVRWMRDSVPVSAEQIRDWVLEGAQTLLKSAASMGGSFALGVMGSLVGFFMMLF
ncbi:MAG TPA: AI-2E family transporter, partial [Steroidobacteraceae bacterium]|nr:AI-2E family transporter [Steroidobacteraceae bacterium]